MERHPYNKKVPETPYRFGPKYVRQPAYGLAYPEPQPFDTKQQPKSTIPTLAKTNDLGF